MTEQEFKVALLKLQHDFEANKKQLMHDYAKTQRRFQIGEIIKDNNTGIIIQVEKFSYYAIYSLPKPVYIGKELRKDLQPKKNGNIERISDSDNVELIKY